jgi:hypothetical protein
MEYEIRGSHAALRGKKVIPPHQCADVSLEHGELFRLEGDPSGQVVQATEGRVWLTQSGDQQDVILEKGQSYCIPRRSLVLLQGLPSGRIRFITTPL